MGLAGLKVNFWSFGSARSCTSHISSLSDLAAIHTNTFTRSLGISFSGQTPLLLKSEKFHTLGQEIQIPWFSFLNAPIHWCPQFHHKYSYKYNKISSMQNPPKHASTRPAPKLHYFSTPEHSLFLHYNQGHLVNLKDRFHLGQLRLFSAHHLYQRQLWSTEHLNTGLDWNHTFFVALIEGLGRFEVRGRADEGDEGVDLVVRGRVDDKEEVLLRVGLEQDFGSDIQKEFWKEFEAYNNSKNELIAEYEQQGKANTENKEKKLQELSKYYDQTQKQKELLIGKLSALLREKVNKLKQFMDDYNIELFQDKLRKFQEEQEHRMISTYQEEEQLGGTLFQPSQDFR